MNGGEFIACAERLAKGPFEADLRSAVSRAYYGAFHEARRLLRECGVWLPKTEQVHVKVGYCLRDCGDAIAEQAAQQLERLKDQRKAADYALDDGRFAGANMALLELARAKRIVENLDRCRKTAEFPSKVRAQAKLLGLPLSD